MYIWNDKECTILCMYIWKMKNVPSFVCTYGLWLLIMVHWSHVLWSFFLCVVLYSFFEHDKMHRENNHNFWGFSLKFFTNSKSHHFHAVWRIIFTQYDVSFSCSMTYHFHAVWRIIFMQCDVLLLLILLELTRHTYRWYSLSKNLW